MMCTRIHRKSAGRANVVGMSAMWHAAVGKSIDMPRCQSSTALSPW